MTIELSHRRIELLPAPGASRVAYVIGAHADAAFRPEARAHLVLVDCPDWNRALSPWPAPACFRGGEDFAGGGEEFLSEMTNELLPAAEKVLGLVSPPRAIVGVSLAGLWALWALTRTDVFCRAASISGSLWFDGFSEYLARTPFLRPPERVYLSLGDREEHTRSARLAAVGDCTRKALNVLKSRGIPSALQMNPGNHFADGPARLKRALDWLYQ